MTQHKVPIDHAARQVTSADFRNFTHILASDESNLRALERTRPRSSDVTAEVRLWGSCLDNKAIPDPYYGGIVCGLLLSFAFCLFRLWREVC